MLDFLYPVKILIGYQLSKKQIKFCETSEEKTLKILGAPFGVANYSKENDGDFSVTYRFYGGHPLTDSVSRYDNKGRIISKQVRNVRQEFDPPGSWKGKIVQL